MVTGWADFTQRRLHHTLALRKFQNGFLQRLHFRQIGELAQPLFGNARRFRADDESLGRTPFTRRNQAVGPGQDRKYDGRHRPPADMCAKQANEIEPGVVRHRNSSAMSFREWRSMRRVPK